MGDGMIIEVTNDAGSIRIEAEKGTLRTYRWPQGEERVKMWRRWQRWCGSKGLYHPSGAHSSNLHLVVEEGQQHFCSEKEAIEWLNYTNPDKLLSRVYTSDGLVIGWRETGGKITGESDFYAVTIEVWQIYINGQKPKNLTGAKTDRIRISYFGSSDPPPLKRSNFKPSQPKRINQRLYSGRAIDLMKERGVTVAAVENILKHGRLLSLNRENNHGMKFFMHNESHLLVVLDNDDRVVTIRP